MVEENANAVMQVGALKEGEIFSGIQFTIPPQAL